MKQSAKFKVKLPVSIFFFNFLFFPITILCSIFNFGSDNVKIIVLGLNFLNIGHNFYKS